MRIAGNRTARQWAALKKMLKANPSPRLWNFAFDKFYLARIETRYLAPIRAIEKNDNYEGAGFSVVALFCTLVEFLESCEQGRNFYVPMKGDKTKRPFTYGPRKASKYFMTFFRRRAPFNRLMPPRLVASFYYDVRCGLLHEARTKEGWKISARYSRGALVAREKPSIVLYRKQLLPALTAYFADYRTRLLSQTRSQKAFIRKFDHLATA